MSLVDSSMIEEMENYKKMKMNDVSIKNISSENQTSNFPIPDKVNPFKYNVLQKRIFGLQKFLSGLLNQRGSNNIGYSKLRKYNDALTSLSRINKFEYGMALDDGREQEERSYSTNKVSFIIFLWLYIYKFQYDM